MLLALEGAGGKRIRVLVEVAFHAHVAAGGGAEGVELGVQVVLRLDEGAAVVAHGLVAGVGVFGEDGDDGGDEDEQEEDEGEGGVVDEEDDAHDAADEALWEIEGLVCVWLRREREWESGELTGSLKMLVKTRRKTTLMKLITATEMLSVLVFLSIHGRRMQTPMR